jgi:hypothetical protein
VLAGSGGVVDEHLQRLLQVSFGSSILREFPSPEMLHSSLLSVSPAPGWGGAALTVTCDKDHLYEYNVWFKYEVCEVGIYFVL